MASAKNHDYHVLPPSIWPLAGALAAIIMLFGAVLGMHAPDPTADTAYGFLDHLRAYWLALLGLLAVLYVMFAWWSEVVHESRTGDHTPVVRLGLKYGFILFIMSEVMFFVAWFWTFCSGPSSSTASTPWGRSRRRWMVSGRPPGSRPSTPGTCR